MLEYKEVLLNEKPLTRDEFLEYALGHGITQKGKAINPSYGVETKIHTCYQINRNGINVSFSGKTRNEKGKWAGISHSNRLSLNDDNVDFCLKGINHWITLKGIKTWGSVLIPDKIPQSTSQKM